MEVIYKKKMYKLSIINCLLVEWYKFNLIARRTSRRLVFLKEVFKKYIIILACVLIYFIMITILGINIGEYKNIIDSLWENKEVIFTSLLLPYFTVAYVEADDRRKKLKNQYFEYYRFKESICKIICFIKSTKKDYKLNYLYGITTKELYEIGNNNEKYNLKESFDELTYILNSMIKLSETGIYGCDLSPIFKALQKEIDIIIGNINQKKQLEFNLIKLEEKNIDDFIAKCNVVLHNISWDWVRDNDIHKKIDKLLS